MISIVIPTWNGVHLLRSCLEAIEAQTPADYEIIVVDNGSTDGTEETLKNEFPSTVCIALDQNYGFSGAVNKGIEMAGENDVILLNNDTRVQAGWLKSLQEAAELYPEYDLFTSHVYQSAQPHLVDTTGDGFTVAGFGYKHDWLKERDQVQDTVREVFGGSGCALYIRRCVFRSIGWFDEDFFAFGEDLDFSFRARLAGFRVLSVPTAKVLHDVRATAPSEKTLFWYHRNLIWLILKNFPWQLLLLYSPHIVLHMGLVLVRSIFRGWSRTYIKSIVSGISLSRKMLIKRGLIQKKRTVKLNDLRRFLDLNWIGIHYHLHKAKKSASRLNSTLTN